MKAFNGVSRRWRFSFVAIYAAVLLSPFFSLQSAPLSTGPAVEAAGEIYSWVNSTTITASGGLLSHTVTFAIIGSSPVNGITFLPTTDAQAFDLTTGCSIESVSISNINGAQATLIANQDTLRANNVGTRGKFKPCDATTTNGFNNLALTLHNTDKQNTNTGKEDPAKQVILVTAVPAYDPSNPFVCNDQINANSDVIPANDTIVLTNSTTSKTVATLKPKFSTVEASAAGCSTSIPGFIEYVATFTNIPPGTYHVCSIIAANCSPNFVKKFNIAGPNQTINGKNKPISFAVAPTTGETTCNFSGAFSFVFCPIFQLAQDLYTKVLEPAVSQELKTGSLDMSDPNVQNAYQVWGQFRTLSNIFFVLVFLVIIFSTTLSLGLNNYDIKKMLPRLVVAAILVQFSWVLMQLAYDVTNLLGVGLQSLPIFTGATLVSKGGPVLHGAVEIGFGSMAGIFVLGTATLLGFAIPLLLMIFTAVLGIFAVFITLILRRFIIIVLVVISPLAFMAWVLPNTEGLFKTWSKMLLRLFLMFPLIVLIFSLAGLFSKINPPDGGSIDGVAAAIVPILAFYMVPMTFKWAGGAMATVGGMVTSRASGISKAARNSQAVKDLNKSRQERAFQTANDPNASGFRRAAARFRSGPGNVLPTDAARRRLAGGYKSAVGIRADEAEAQIQNLGLTGDELTGTLLALANGQSSHGVAANQGSQRKAIEMLSQKRDYASLAQLREGYGGDNMDAAHARIWNDGIRSTIGDISTNAPDLIQGASAFNNINADQIASMHHSTARRMMQYAVREKTAGNAAVADGIYQAYQQVIASPQMRGRIRRETNLAVRDFSGVFSTTDPAGHVDTTNTLEIQHAVDDTGNITP